MMTRLDNVKRDVPAGRANSVPPGECVQYRVLSSFANPTTPRVLLSLNVRIHSTFSQGVLNDYMYF